MLVLIRRESFGVCTPSPHFSFSHSFHRNLLTIQVDVDFSPPLLSNLVQQLLEIIFSNWFNCFSNRFSCFFREFPFFVFSNWFNCFINWFSCLLYDSSPFGCVLINFNVFPRPIFPLVSIYPFLKMESDVACLSYMPHRWCLELQFAVDLSPCFCVSRCTSLCSRDDHIDGAKMLTDLYLKLGGIFLHLLW